MTIRAFEGHRPQLAAGVYVDPAALVVGEVSMGEDSSIWPFSVARGDVNNIVIGARTNIQDNSVLHVSHQGPHNPRGSNLVVGEDVTVGHRVILHACRVGNRCLIGMGATVMDDALIPDDTMVAAGSLVPPNKQLEGGWLWMGAPVKKVRQLTAQELAGIAYSAQHYVRLKNRHLDSDDS